MIGRRDPRLPAGRWIRIDRRGALAGGLATLVPAAPLLAGAAAGPDPLGFGWDQIDATVRRWMDEGVYAGVGIVVARRGGIAFERYWGDQAPDRVEHVASAGKWVAAAVVAALVDEGFLRWTDTAGRFVEGLNPMMARATLAQLLSHTAGYPDYQPEGARRDDYQTLAESVSHVRPLAADTAPGERFLYGGLAMQVAGRMAEIASGSDWETLFRSRIAMPLGMARSAFTPVSAEPGFGPMLGGGLRTTARDMVAFLGMVRAGGVAAGRRVLSEHALAAMQRDHVGSARIASERYVDEVRATDRNDVYGLGEWREEVAGDGTPTLLSSPGWAGAYPWIDRRFDVHGMVVAKVDPAKAAAAGFNSFLSSPVAPWLVRDACDDERRPDWRRGYAPVAAGRLYWESVGTGPPLILVHGHSLDRTMWDPQTAALSAHHRVIRYDLRGYGRSSLPTEGAPFMHAHDLAALMDHLGLKRAHVAGLSLGGSVAVDMLALHPGRLLSATAASGDVFDFCPGPSEAWTAQAMAARRSEIAALRAGGVWRYKRGWLNSLTRHGGSRVDAIKPKLWKMISAWSAWQPLHLEPRLILGRDAPSALRARAPDTPVLVIAPEVEANRPNLLASLLPNARTEIIRDAGHMSNMEQPEAFAAALLDFLARSTLSSPPAA